MLKISEIVKVLNNLYRGVQHREDARIPIKPQPKPEQGKKTKKGKPVISIKTYPSGELYLEHRDHK